ncbi:MAG: phosphoribosyltransferase [Chloroflexota bacterium]
MGKLRILSHSEELFPDRAEAGRLLGEALKDLSDKKAVVLGIPRGGVIVAAELARVIQAGLDIVLSRKLGAPDNPELAIGAIAEDGEVVLHHSLITALGVSQSYIKEEKTRQLAEINRRSQLVRGILPRLNLKDRTVIVTDDGVATGATLQAALWLAHKAEPKNLIAALPVGPEETLTELARDCDEMVCLRAPYGFASVGQFYRHFPQVEDEEVLSLLSRVREEKTHGTGK